MTPTTLLRSLILATANMLAVQAQAVNLPVVSKSTVMSPSVAKSVLSAAPESAFSYKVRAVNKSILSVELVAAPGYYLYREKLNISIKKVAITSINFPPVQTKADTPIGRADVYRGAVKIGVALGKLPATKTLAVSLKYQVCSDSTSECYQGVTKVIDVVLP